MNTLSAGDVVSVVVRRVASGVAGESESHCSALLISQSFANNRYALSSTLFDVQITQRERKRESNKLNDTQSAKGVKVHRK